MKNRKKLYTAIFFFYALLVFAVSSYPSLEIPFRLPSRFLQPDKLAHFIEYFIFAALYYLFRRQFQIRQKDILIELFLWAMIIPIFDEMHQLFIPGRSFEWYDVIADMLGFFTFIILNIIIYKTRRKDGNH
ncbi:MAG: VanZ family protein [Candidatus Cloacimonetes bacterium]|nr:VanZ family protein [Candidatus Cloacimonadota bacterium]